MNPVNSPASHEGASSRRKFITLSALSAGVVLGSSFLPRAGAAEEVVAPKPKKKIPIGIELYAVRGELTKDLPGTLRAVAKMGYEVVEFYSPYFGWTFPFAKDVRTQLDDLGLRCLSTHNGVASLTPGETMGRAIELNQILGARQIVLASAPAWAKGLDGWKKLCAQLTVASNELKTHGLAAGFHNHHSEWLPVAPGGPRIMDVIAAETPKEFVLQLDVGTAMEAGVDAIAWIRANPGRIKSIHLKDWTPGEKAQEKGYRVLFTEGVTPWKALLAEAESVGGVEHYLMEQEGSRFPELETAERCLATWKKLRAAG